jgi:hypothetical protein
MNEQWYYTIGGARFGPLTVEHLAKLIASGECRPDVLVWRAGLAQWVRADSQPQIVGKVRELLRSKHTGKPSAPSFHLPNWVWSVALFLIWLAWLLSIDPLSYPRQLTPEEEEQAEWERQVRDPFDAYR